METNKRHEPIIAWEQRVDRLLAGLGEVSTNGVEAPTVEAVHDQRIPPDEAQENINSYLETFLEE